MRDSKDRPISVGDFVNVGADIDGVVVCSIDTREGTPEHPIEKWEYLNHGVIVDTKIAGLVHVAESAQILIIK